MRSPVAYPFHSPAASQPFFFSLSIMLFFFCTNVFSQEIYRSCKFLHIFISQIQRARLRTHLRCIINARRLECVHFQDAPESLQFEPRRTFRRSNIDFDEKRLCNLFVRCKHKQEYEELLSAADDEHKYTLLLIDG